MLPYNINVCRTGDSAFLQDPILEKKEITQL